MSGVLSIRATALVPKAIASSTDTSSVVAASRRSGRSAPSRSISRMMRSMARTASVG